MYLTGTGLFYITTKVGCIKVNFEKENDTEEVS